MIIACVICVCMLIVFSNEIDHITLEKAAHHHAIKMTIN